MKMFTNLLKCTLQLCAIGWSIFAFADNQTATLSPIIPEDDHLPFSIEIEVSDFQLLNGLHSGATAEHDDKWLFIAGRTNGMHGFGSSDDNFPPQRQNDAVYVVDIAKKKCWSRSLNDPMSGLDQNQIDTLAVTSPQSYQSGNTLYITGGYGVITSTGNFSTKDKLTAIDIPGLMHWVMHPSTPHTAAHSIRQTSDPSLQVTGGFMTQAGDEPTLLVFGQNFTGFYHDSSDGDYTQQVRRFKIIDDGKELKVDIKEPRPSIPDPSYRRRDLNVVPIMEHKDRKTVPAFIAFSGVFTLTTGVWTVPVHITENGTPSMADPNNPKTFKQGMNNYVTAALGLYSRKYRHMYSSLLGGISFGFFQNGQFETDPEIPFTNQCTTIKRNRHGHYKQYLMNVTYPVIISELSNPGNPLLFGAGSYFFPVYDVPQYANGVLKLDKLKKRRTLVGYIVGGIQSTVPNTTLITDSSASPYIFKVYVKRKR